MFLNFKTVRILEGKLFKAEVQSDSKDGGCQMTFHEPLIGAAGRRSPVEVDVGR